MALKEDLILSNSKNKVKREIS